jgi:hypothetical protein
MSGWFMLCHAWTAEVRLSQFLSCYVQLFQVVRLGHFITGKVRLVLLISGCQNRSVYYIISGYFSLCHVSLR